MKVLILGGSKQIGKRFCEKCLTNSSDYNLTVFNRGHQDQLYSQGINFIQGDRYTNDLCKVLGQTWDVVIDECGYMPGNIQYLMDNLRGKVSKYIFISSVSAYRYKRNKAYQAPFINETFETKDCKNYQKNALPVDKFYGVKKAECERIILNTDGLDAIILRPSYIYGKYENTYAIYYWYFNIVAHSEVIIPNYGNDMFTISFIDDLVDSINHLVQAKKHRNIYNIVTHRPVSVNYLVSLIEETTGKKANRLYLNDEDAPADDKCILNDIPFSNEGESMLFDNSKILSDLQNLRFTDFGDSIRQSIEEYRKLPLEEPAEWLSASRAKFLHKKINLK